MDKVIKNLIAKLFINIIWKPALTDFPSTNSKISPLLPLNGRP